jgi:CHAD domain-containing protein
MISNEQAVRTGDPEGVHQMRVALRRLRAAISIFKGLLAGAETERVKAELKWLTDQLSDARSLDVLVGEVQPLEAATPVSGVARILQRDLRGRRDAALRNARIALDSGRYQELGLNTALWLANGAWTRSNAAPARRPRQRPVAPFAAKVLRKRLKKIRKQAKRVDRLDPAQRHKLRIRVKKLRYGAEFFAGAFPGSKRDARRKNFVKAAKRLQSALGVLNDTEFQNRTADSIAHARPRSKRQPAEALAMGFVTGQSQARAALWLARIKKARKDLAARRPFWR